MLPVRIAFDPSLPVVTSAAFHVGERTFVADEPFPWRDLGVTEQNLHEMWRAGMISFVPADSVVITFNVTPGETVNVETPAQKRQRRRRPQPTE